MARLLALLTTRVLVAVVLAAAALAAGGGRDVKPPKPGKPGKPKRDTSRHLIVATYNVKEGRGDSAAVGAVRNLLDDLQDSDERPDVVVLNEAGNYLDAIRRHFGSEYRVLAKRNRPESASTMMLVRRSVKVVRWRQLVNKLGWWGPFNGLRHAGRTWPLVFLKGWVGLGMHMVPGGPRGGTNKVLRGRNRSAWLENVRTMASVMARPLGKLRRGRWVVGDQNQSADDQHADGLVAWAKTNGYDIERAGGGVDWALVKYAEAKGRALPSYGSDHRARVYHLRRDGGRAARAARAVA